MSDHYRKLENMYLGAKIQRLAYPSTTIHIEKDTAEIGLEVEDKYFHALEALHGSVYFKLLDDAAFFAASSAVHDVFILTTSFHINLYRPVKKGKLRAVGKLRFQSRNYLTAEASLFDERGREVASGTGSFAKTKNPLTPEMGYE